MLGKAQTFARGGVTCLSSYKPFADCWGISSPLQNKPFETIFSCCWCFNLWVVFFFFINLSDWHESSWPHLHGVKWWWNEKSWCPTAMLQRTNKNMNISSWDAGKLMAPFSSGMESLGKDRHDMHLYKPCISVYFLIFYNIWFIKLCLDIRTTSKWTSANLSSLSHHWSPQ